MQFLTNSLPNSQSQIGEHPCPKQPTPVRKQKATGQKLTAKWQNRKRPNSNKDPNGMELKS